MRTIKYLITHHTASPQVTSTWEKVNHAHMIRNWGSSRWPVYAKPSSLGYYGQYHYYIDYLGNVKQFRTHEEIGWHAGKWLVNKQSIAVCLGGNFNVDVPTEAQLKAYEDIMFNLEAKYPNAVQKFHRDIKATACPGNWWTKERQEALLKLPDLAANPIEHFLYKLENGAEVYLRAFDGSLHHITSWRALQAITGASDPKINIVDNIDKSKISFPIGDK